MAYSFDRAEWLESRGFLQRKLVFLDLNFWINLAEPRKAQYENLALLMSDAVQAGNILCPVSPSLLVEFSKRPQDARREIRSQMMDKLSCGLSLRTIEQNLYHEFEAVLNGRELKKGWGYSHFRDEFPGQFTTNESITNFLNSEQGKILHSNATEMSCRFSERTLLEQEWRHQNAVTQKEIEDGEFGSTFQTFLPTMRQVISTLYPHSLPEWKTGELRKNLDACPTFWCSYKMMSEVRRNRMKVDTNDVWDFLNVGFAIPYVDCLACDGFTWHICSNVLQMDAKYGVRIVSKCEDLVEWLESLSDRPE